MKVLCMERRYAVGFLWEMVMRIIFYRGKYLLEGTRELDCVKYSMFKCNSFVDSSSTIFPGEKVLSQVFWVVGGEIYFKIKWNFYIFPS